jgi:hypothetical protein
VVTSDGAHNNSSDININATSQNSCFKTPLSKSMSDSNKNILLHIETAPHVAHTTSSISTPKEKSHNQITFPTKQDISYIVSYVIQALELLEHICTYAFSNNTILIKTLKQCCKNITNRSYLNINPPELYATYCDHILSTMVRDV